jgi:3-hydroxymyristoyl/3-hydroxydecanoyl-(acyl carrier protein) dehydratase
MSTISKEGQPMDDRWEFPQDVKVREANRIESLVYVPENSLWFCGHFPGEPILPGIALIYMAEQAISRNAGEKGEPIRLDGLKRVRFTHPVRPGEKLSLKVTGEQTGNETLYSFKVASAGNIVCSGLIAARKIKK